MQGGDSEPTDAVLLEALNAARGDQVRIIAVLWTWLECHMGELTSLREKPPAILEAALRRPPFEGITDGVLKWLLDSPLRRAAELLAWIGRERAQVTTPLLIESRGFDGREVVVAWGASELVRRIDGNEFPPSVVEHPSLTTLAPTLLVSPRVVNQIELKAFKPFGPAWEAVKRKLDRGLAKGRRPPLTLHLDTLAEHGLSGLSTDERLAVARFDAERIDPDDQDRCAAAARAAVRRAKGDASLLVLPELAATPPVLEAIGDELRKMHPAAPALTVVGLYHLSAEDGAQRSSLVADEELAASVNEAIVLGPGGAELWRHRKLTCAEGEDPHGGRQVVEDIRLGRRITVVPTPLGNVAVAICLDAFAAHARERFAKAPANVLLVPSLSPTVHRHRDSLQHLVQLIWGIAFVCNRSPYHEQDGPSVWNDERHRSFWTVARGGPSVFGPKADGDHPSFVFRLAAELARRRRRRRRRKP